VGIRKKQQIFMLTLDMSTFDIYHSPINNKEDKKMKYALKAENIQGATVTFKANTIKAVINQFKNTYSTKGWIIGLFCNDTGAMLKTIKSTYR
jgi:hypothetical protein